MRLRRRWAAVASRLLMAAMLALAACAHEGLPDQTAGARAGAAGAGPASAGTTGPSLTSRQAASGPSLPSGAQSSSGLGPAPGAGAPSGPSAPSGLGAWSLRLTVLHTNDHHGHAWASISDGRTVGGLAARAALVERIRAEVAARGGHVLLLDAGDFNTGTFCSDELRAEPDVTAYRIMGYHAAALGNHEFDVSLEILLRQAGQAGFPFLGANVVLVANAKPVLGDVAEWTLGGVRVAALGLAPQDSPRISTRGSDPRIRFLDPSAVAASRLPLLRQRARVVIGLFHLEIEEIERLVGRVPGIDLVVSGHDHRALETPRRVGNTVIVQAGSDGKHLGRVDLEVPEAGPVVVRDARLYPVTGDLPDDPRVAAALARMRARCSGDRIVGRLAMPARRDAFVDGPGTPPLLANLVADALREAAQADVALVNRGGMRADLPAGPVSRQQVHDTLPFADTLTVFDVTGADMARLVAEMAQRKPGGPGTLYPSGIEIEFLGRGRARILRGGRPLGPKERLTLVVSTFLASGGDGYGAFATFRRLRSLPISPEGALEAYLAKHDPARPACEARTRWRGVTDKAMPRPCRLERGAPPP